MYFCKIQQGHRNTINHKSLLMKPEKMNAKVRFFKSELSDKKLIIKFFKLCLIHKAVHWAQIETSNSRSTVSVVQWYFENRNISMGL